MDSIAFLQDLAIVMIVAGFVTLLFHRLKQPVVLGYLLAGFIIGPFTPPFPLVRDTGTIQTLADLGVVFLMFSLGIDFNLRKLRKVGFPALWIAVTEISAMILTGVLLGKALGWAGRDGLMLGFLLSLTSTMIVVKSLRDRGEIHSRHAELISGVSLIDDLVVILLMVALPGLARTGSLPAGEMVALFGGLFLFLAAAIVLGLLLVPRLLGAIARHANDETMLVVSLGLCFGVSLLALKLGFSTALGAFVIGAVVSESRYSGKISDKMVPLRDMFCAVFFVAIGMQIAPRFVLDFLPEALIITVVYLVAKVLACAAATLMAGESPTTSLRVGTHMAQLGEFAFLLATLGFQLGLSGEFLYPLIVAVAAMNALLRPYLVDNVPWLVHALGRHVPPQRAAALLAFTTHLRQRLRPHPGKTAARLVINLGSQIVIGVALIAAGFLVVAHLARRFPEAAALLPPVWRDRLFPLVWLCAVVLLLPLYVGSFRKMQALAMLLSEIVVPDARRRSGRALRGVVRGIFTFLQGLVLLAVTVLASASLLPAWQALGVLLGFLALLLLRHGRAFNRWYSEAKFALVAVVHEPSETAPVPPPPDPLSHLRDAHLRTVTVRTGPHAGRLIREVELRTLTGATIVAVERGGHSKVNPGPDEELLAGDQLLLLGSPRQLDQATDLFSAGA